MVVEKPVKKIALNGGRQLLDTIIEDIDKIERASLPSRWAWIIENWKNVEKEAANPSVTN